MKKENFDELVESVRETIKWIDMLPDAEKDRPLIELGRDLKALLEEYEKRKSS